MTDAELLALIEATPAAPTRVGTLVRGAVQGLSAGTAEELVGALRATKLLKIPQDIRTPGPKALAKLYPGLPYPEAASRWFNENRPDVKAVAEAEGARQEQQTGYRVLRNEERAKNEAASAAHPGFYFGGQVAGSIPGMLLTGGSLPAVAGQGSIQGAGYSDSDTGAGLLGDISLGTAGGLLGYGAGKLLGKATQGVAGMAGRRTAAASQKAAELADKTVGKELNVLRGAYGGARQNTSRAVEVLLRAEQEIQDPALKAQVAALRSSPKWVETVENVAKNYADDFGGLATADDAAKTAYQAAQANLAKNLADEKARQLSTGMMKEQLKARLKRYGPMGVAGAIAGHTLGGPGGLILGGAAGAAVRPMLHAVRRAAQHPAVQTAVWSPIERGAVAASRPGVALLRDMATRGIGTAAALGAGGSVMSHLDPEAAAEAELERLLNEGK